ncbi:unnamed protein product [Sympodiomycopsis kandeliae]
MVALAGAPATSTTTPSEDVVVAATSKEQKTLMARISSPSAPTPFHPSLGMPSESLRYRVSPLFPTSQQQLPDLELRLEIPPASVPFIFAHRQWRAGLILADYLAICGDLKDTTVLELGCGTGIPGMVARSIGQCQVSVLTDYDSPTLVSVLKSNLVCNFSSQEIKTHIRSIGYTWGTSTEDVQDLLSSLKQPKSTFHRILLADCMWDSLSHSVLCKSLTSFLTRNADSRVLVVSGLHTGREKIVSFLRRAYSVGLELVDIDSGHKIFPMLQVEELRREDEAGACENISKYIYELELNTAEEEVLERGVIDAKSEHRLTGKRRRFVMDELDEEKKENGGVHLRNRWITIWALKWRSEWLTS